LMAEFVHNRGHQRYGPKGCPPDVDEDVPTKGAVVPDQVDLVVSHRALVDLVLGEVVETGDHDPGRVHGRPPAEPVDQPSQAGLIGRGRVGKEVIGGQHDLSSQARVSQLLAQPRQRLIDPQPILVPDRDLRREDAHRPIMTKIDPRQVRGRAAVQKDSPWKICFSRGCGVVYRAIAAPEPDL
jgi:hypothetical protein